MDREALLGRLKCAVRSQQKLPVGIAQRAEAVVRHHLILETELPDRLGDQLRAGDSPRQLRYVNFLTKSPTIFDGWAAGSGLDYTRVYELLVLDQFRGEDVFVVDVKGLQADHVGIDPPAATVAKELISKEI